MKIRAEGFEEGFLVMSLLLLISIPFGYFFSSFSFGVWVIYSVIWIIKNKQFKINKKLIPFFLFTLFMMLSFLWSIDSETTNKKLLRQLPLFLFALVGLFLPKIQKEQVSKYFNKFAYFLAIFGIILLLIAFSNYIKFQYKGFLFYHSLVSPLELNAIYVSYIVSVVLLFKIQSITYLNLVDYLVIIALGLFLLLLASKMVLLITVFILIYILISRFQKKNERVLVLAVMVISLFFVIAFIKPIKNRFYREFNTVYAEILTKESFKKGRVYTGLEARLLQVRAYKEIINTPKEFVLGLGLSASNGRLEAIHKKLNTPKVFQKYNFHNQYIQTLADTGFIGLVLLLVTLFKGYRQCLSTKVFLPFIIITLALFITESVIWRQRGILFFGLIYVIIFLLDKKDESKKQVSKIQVLL